MGTNYYLKQNICKHCGKTESELHIGKSSGGWYFALHVIPELGLNNLNDWKISVLHEKDSRIFDEYGGEIGEQDMLDIICKRANPIKRTGDYLDPTFWKKFLNQNQAEEGANGLIRAKIDGIHCIGHGEGTWDLIVGEFR